MTDVRRMLAEEARSIALGTVFFAAWFLVLMALKTLVLEEYRIRFSGVAAALVGALVAAKVVALLRHVTLLGPIERGPAWLWVVARTALYTLGVLVAATLERAFETRAEHGGFGAAFAMLVDDPHWPHLLAATLGAGLAMLVYNTIEVIRRHVGGDALRRMFAAPLAPPGPETEPAAAQSPPDRTGGARR
jgi:hypothetical protein